MPNWNDTPPPGEGGWMNMYDGIDWRFRNDGIYLRGENQPLRTAGDPMTCQAIIDRFGRYPHRNHILGR